MMKKIKLISYPILAVLVLCLIVLGHRHITPTEIIAYSDRLVPEDLTEVEEWADIIVIGTAVSRAGSKAYNENEVHLSTGYTSSFFKVETVIKPDNRVTVGDVIEIEEPYIEYREFDGLYIVRPSDQIPMEYGQRYLLFLTAQNQAGFSTELFYLLDLPEMKYVWPLPLNDDSYGALEIPSDILDHYSTFLQQVNERYGKYQQAE